MLKWGLLKILLTATYKTTVPRNGMVYNIFNSYKASQSYHFTSHTMVMNQSCRLNID